MQNKSSLKHLITILTCLFIITNCSSNAGQFIDTSKITPAKATHIKIETAPGGNGTEVLTTTLNNGSPITLYAVSRSNNGQFVANVSVNWTDSGSLGYLSQLTGTSTTYTPNSDEGAASVSAAHATLIPDSTGTITVTYDVESISGLTLWLKADSILGSLANGDEVTIWEDQNGSARSVTSLGVGQGPIFETNSINGLPVLSFDASENNGFISTFPISDIITNSAYTYFIVYSATSISTDSIDPPMNNALIIDNGGFVGATLRSSTPLVQSYNWDGIAAVATKNTSLTTNNLFTSYHDSGSIYSQLNGDTATTALSGDTIDLTNFLTIGGGYAPAGFYDGDIAEIIVYNTALSPTDRFTVQSYLCTKYNITCP